MSKGGSRNRSGPGKDPASIRSAQAGFTLTALPATYDGEIPEFPLGEATARELALWREKWSGPHGAAWSQPSEHWRWWDVAMWVRTAVRCEAPDAGPTLIANLHRLGDRVGLSTAGLAEMGWAIAVDQTAAKRDERKPAAKQGSARDRMKVVPGGSGA